MQSDFFDKKIKDAADHHHPAYDEKAWVKMERLLNKHLPQEEDNWKRIIFFILLFVVTGLGTWLLISKPWQSGKTVAGTETVQDELKNKNAEGLSGPTGGQQNSTTTTIPTVGSGELQENHVPDARPKSMNSENVSSSVNDPNTPRVDQSNVQSEFIVSKASVKSKNRKATTAPTVENKSAKEVKKENNPPTPVEAVAEVKPQPAEANASVNSSSPIVNAVTERPTVKQDAEVKDDKVDNTIEPAIAATKPNADSKQIPKDKSKNKRSSSFFVSFSTGPDLSFVGSGNSSTVKLLAGAGIGYTFKERLTIRTGFYSARKIYSAKPSDYKAPDAFYTYYPYLEKIDANCQVYEIPIALSYNFGKKSNWFVSAAISSILMKEETYDYTYKYTPTGNTYTSRWSIKDENKHYFSMGTLSAGYKRDIGKRVTIMAEPYIKVPFAGVGYGKVKLNSGGVMFTAGIKLF